MRAKVRKVLLILGVLLIAGFVGAKVNQFLLDPPLADLSEIRFGLVDKEVSQMPVVEVFFVTNRKSAEAEGTFDNASGDSVVYGMAEVRMPAKLRVGDVQVPEIPRQLVDNNRAVIMKVTLLSRDKFDYALKERLSILKHRTFDLFVHGINHTFDSAVRQAATLRFDLDMPQPMVVFAWPTGPGVFPSDYNRDREQMPAASKHLADFLDSFHHHIDPQSMSVVAHSLGCKVVCDAFDILVKDPAWSDPEKEIGNIVLAAPDVNRDDFDHKFIEEMAVVAKRVTIYTSRNDGVLMISSFLNGSPRAGEFDYAELSLIELLMEKNVNAPHIEVVDATFVNNVFNAHSAFYQSRAAFHDFHHLLRNDVSAEERHLLRHERAGSANYWILRP